MTVGLILFARTPVGGSLLVDVLPGTIAIGLGAGIAFNPLLLAAMSGVAPTEFGLASGVVNTAFMMGGALALAALASVAAARSDSLRSSGEAELEALNGGYNAAFIIGAVFAAAATVVAAALLRAEQPAGAEEAPDAAPAAH
jgi:hypothetical protein